MNRRIGPVVNLGHYSAVLSYWPLSQARWHWWPKRTPIPERIAEGALWEWGALDLMWWRSE